MSNNNQSGVGGFQSRKVHCLGKRDKSNAGRIDPRAVEICAAINARVEYYTTSSCAGRCLMYRGDGIKSHHHYAVGASAGQQDNGDEERSETPQLDSDFRYQNQGGLGYFERFRVNHDVVRDANRYFDINTLDSTREDYDPCGGGDPIRSVGQFEHRAQLAKLQSEKDVEAEVSSCSTDSNEAEVGNAFGASTDAGTGLGTQPAGADRQRNKAIWLRFEPFILHVACRSLSAASALMSAARPAFKNVGLTSWKHGYGKYIVAIWGDEGLDLPLCDPVGVPLFSGQNEWLQSLVNERHHRNWAKIERFVKGVRAMPDVVDGIDAVNGMGGVELEPMMEEIASTSSIHEGYSTNALPKTAIEMPKRFDMVGDVAVLYSMPSTNKEGRESIGNAIMAKNKAIKVCVARTSSLTGTERTPGDSGLAVIAGANRSPLITTHTEYGIKCVVDLNHTFFSPRMGPERLRICQQVARGENVLVLFSGVGMDAMQIAGRTEASSVVAVELNPVAVECAKRGQRMLKRNKAVKCMGAADRLRIIEGNVLDVLPTLELGSYDRILAPRPKEGNLDGDLGFGDGGVVFLEALLPLMKAVGGECHWYDFAADHELPSCERTRQTILRVCDNLDYGMEVINVAKVGSIAKRQVRVCLDFRLTGKKKI